MVITCDNVCELLLMERRVTGKPSCTVRGGGKAGNIRTCRLTYHHRKGSVWRVSLTPFGGMQTPTPSQ